MNLIHILNKDHAYYTVILFNLVEIIRIVPNIICSITAALPIGDASV